jgi:hypothetical protein
MHIIKNILSNHVYEQVFLRMRSFMTSRNFGQFLTSLFPHRHGVWPKKCFASSYSHDIIYERSQRGVFTGI